METRQNNISEVESEEPAADLKQETVDSIGLDGGREEASYSR